MNTDVAMFWTLLDGRLRLKVLGDPSILRQEVKVRNLRDCIIME